MTAELQLLTGEWSTLGDAAYRVRYQVFVVEQGVPVALEHDEADNVSFHLIVQSGDEAVATGRLLPDGHIGRVAVLPAWRSRGVGSLIMQRLIQEAAHMGHKMVVVHAQVDAERFYTTLGFIRDGDVFMEAGIPHRIMRKDL